MLKPAVAALFELTTHTTRLHVVRLGRDVDLTQISVEEAEELLALPGGFEWLRRRPVPPKRRRAGGSTHRPH